VVASSELEKRPDHGVDPYEEPSVDWGWHGGFPNGTRIFLGITAVMCLLMVIGNHRGKTEDIYLVAIGVGLLVLLGVQERRKRHSWRN
jgi:hypothetical protein